MRADDEATDIQQVDVLLTSSEEISRIHNMSVLAGFGFNSERVVVAAEDACEIIAQIKQLETGCADMQNSPVIVFLPPQSCHLVSQNNFSLWIFLVCQTDSATQVKHAPPGEECCGNCTVPRELDETSLRALFDLFCKWWVAKKTFYSAEQRRIKFQEAAERKQAARAAKLQGRVLVSDSCQGETSILGEPLNRASETGACVKKQIHPSLASSSEIVQPVGLMATGDDTTPAGAPGSARDAQPGERTEAVAPPDAAAQDELDLAQQRRVKFEEAKERKKVARAAKLCREGSELCKEEVTAALQQAQSSPSPVVKILGPAGVIGPARGSTQLYVKPGAIINSAVATAASPAANADGASGYIDLSGAMHSGCTPESSRPISERSEDVTSASGLAHRATGLCHLDRGNTLGSLGKLRPSQSPFEDIKIMELVGKGTFGNVYRAQWDSAIVALKVVQQPKASHSDALFEGALSATLAHPCLVQTFKYSIGELNQNESCHDVWIVQEWCGMGSLGSAQNRSKVLGQGGYKQGGYTCIAAVSSDVASGTSYLHSRGVVHGDLTGNNILCAVASCPKGFVAKVCDFGMSRVLGEHTRIETKSFGTVAFMPPESFAVEGTPAMTPKVDVYAFGMVVWMLCSNENPWSGLSGPQIVLRVWKGDRPPPLPAELPACLNDLYQRCTMQAPEARPTLREITSELLRILTMELDSASSG